MIGLPKSLNNYFEDCVWNILRYVDGQYSVDTGMGIIISISLLCKCGKRVILGM